MAARPAQIAILAFPGVQSLDVMGPHEVFHGADRAARAGGRSHPGYRITVLGSDASPLRCSSGLAIVPDATIAHAPGPIDTLIVAGGRGARKAASDPALVEWVARTARQARRTASVCTGTFVLAATGLLDGRRATTHWARARELAELHPAVEVDAEPIYLHEGRIWTSAGVTAGMDMALAMVEEDIDRELALTVARHLVLYLRRPGSQAQFSAALAAQEPAREALRDAQRFAVEHPSSDLSVDAMAARAHMSPRHFARAFRAQTGMTPGRFVERVRLEVARQRLEDSDNPIAAVAAASGFPSAETMRRSFLRVLGVSPAEYRRRFRPAHPRLAA